MATRECYPHEQMDDFVALADCSAVEEWLVSDTRDVWVGFDFAGRPVVCFAKLEESPRPYTWQQINRK